MYAVVLLLALSGLCYAQKQERPECNGTWTVYYDMDNPGGTGDWEMYANIKPQPCRTPIAQHYLPVVSGFNINVFPNNGGVYCVNANQPNRRCPDLRVAFCCSKESQCDKPGYSWTDWQDIDDPHGSTGDYELLSTMVASNADEICENPIEIDARVVPGSVPWQLSGDVLTVSPSVGLICKNEDQPGEKCCEDYEVRFCCKLCAEEGEVGDIDQLPVEVSSALLP